MLRCLKDRYLLDCPLALVQGRGTKGEGRVPSPTPAPVIPSVARNLCEATILFSVILSEVSTRTQSKNLGQLCERWRGVARPHEQGRYRFPPFAKRSAPSLTTSFAGQHTKQGLIHFAGR